MPVTAARRLFWLCNELTAGNAFSSDHYRQWAQDALAELETAETHETEDARGARRDPCYSETQQEMRR